MKISNIQENLSKTELIQRLQQIMQDAARASQDVQTARGQERSRVAQEQVETSQEAEQDRVREDGRGPQQDGGQKRRRRRSEKPDPAADPRKISHLPPSDEGRFIDITV
ncbi:MAG TPA: hypothetical protein PK280_04945 [Planctomycetota bacterium]|nr:hypothetical protein [Planctomycetota bacterium]